MGYGWEVKKKRYFIKNYETNKKISLLLNK